MFGCSGSRAVETISPNVAAAEETPSVWYGPVQLLSIPADSEFRGGAAFAEVRSVVGLESFRSSQLDDRPSTLSRLHSFERDADFVERDPVGDQRSQVELLGQYLFGDDRDVAFGI